MLFNLYGKQFFIAIFMNYCAKTNKLILKHISRIDRPLFWNVERRTDVENAEQQKQTICYGQ